MKCIGDLYRGCEDISYKQLHSVSSFEQNVLKFICMPRK